MGYSQNNISSTIEVSRKELLDLGLRNPLLNYRPSRARGVEVVDELPTEVFRILVRERKSMSFKAVPAKSDGEAEENGHLVQPGDETEGGELAARHLDLQLQTTLTSARLQSRLIKTERDARTFIEEQGVNVLYLVLGMLRWFEAESSQESRRAPLILVPVELERSNVQERYRLKYTEEDLDDNLSLVNKLRLEFGVDLPDLSSQEDLDIDHYFDAVEEALRSHPRWSVDRDAVVLGFFSFGKLLMYRDLDEESWPEGSKLSDHPVIRTLFDESSYEKPAQLSEEEHLDEHLDPADIHQVLDADSSQSLALLDVKSRRSLVIQGPPGTGKSQTITNLIAEAVGQGRTVLFVAEKMAALEVVKRRLDSVGLGEACLELHSRKTNKKAVLQELNRILSLGRPRLEQTEDNLRILTDLRDRLNEYSEAMNTPIGESDTTPYRVIGELVRLGPKAASLPRLDFEAMRQWTGSDFRRRQGLVEELQAKLSQMGVPEQNLFYGSPRTVLLPTEEARISEVFLLAQTSTRTLRQSAAELATTLMLSVPETRSNIEVLCRAARRATQAPRLEGVQLRSDEWQARRDDLQILIEAGKGYSELRERYDEMLIPEAWDQDLLETRQHLSAYGHKWWRPLSGNYREARNRLNGLCREPLPNDVDEQLALVDAVLEAQRHHRVVGDYEALGSSLFGAQWQGERSDWRMLDRLLEWIVGLYREVDEGQLPEGLIDFLADEPATEGLEKKIVVTEQALLDQGSAVARVAEVLEFADEIRSALEEEHLSVQEATFDAWHRHLDQLQSLVTYNQLSETCLREGLGSVLRQAESWPEAGSSLVDAYQYTWFEGLVEQAFRERPALAKFDRDNHEYVAEKFRELDKLVIEHNRARLAHAHWQGGADVRGRRAARRAEA